MTHASPKVKDHIKDANSMNIGWYSHTAEREVGKVYIYKTPDGKGEMRLTSISKLNARKPIWKDIVCKGEVGQYVKTIKINGNTMEKINWAGF